jgi:hypothetical protein
MTQADIIRMAQEAGGIESNGVINAYVQLDRFVLAAYKQGYADAMEHLSLKENT